jgi:hypothetical protein
MTATMIYFVTGMDIGYKLALLLMLTIELVVSLCLPLVRATTTTLPWIIAVGTEDVFELEVEGDVEEDVGDIRRNRVAKLS